MSTTGMSLQLALLGLPDIALQPCMNPLLYPLLEKGTNQMLSYQAAVSSARVPSKTLPCPCPLQATEKKAWAGVGRLFSPPRSMTTISHTFKSVYEKLLLPFEEVSLVAPKVACSDFHH